MSRPRRIVLSVLALMFYGLAVATVTTGGPWYIPICWLMSGTVLLLVVRKTGGLRSDRPRAGGAGDDPVRRARRSGNPAVRAGVEPPKQP